MSVHEIEGPVLLGEVVRVANRIETAPWWLAASRQKR